MIVIPRLRSLTAATLGMTTGSGRADNLLALPRASSYVRQRGTTFPAKEPNPAMMQHQLLTSMIRKAPIFFGLLGVVRLGASKSVVYTAGGRAP